MTRRIHWLLWPALALVAVPAAAHPGHGASADSASLTHYMTEPFHAAILMAVVVAIMAIGGWMSRQIGGLRFKPLSRKALAAGFYTHWPQRWMHFVPNRWCDRLGG